LRNKYTVKFILGQALFPILKFLVLELLAVLEARISGMMWKDEDKSWNCSVCGKISKSKTDITRHIEGLHLDHPGFKCDACGEVVKSRNALRQHKSNRHAVGLNVKYIFDPPS